MTHSSVFGPVHSRRFGLSLGVDVVASATKQCNFDCLYCELAKSKKTDQLSLYKEPDDIAKEVEAALRENRNIDFITVTANGEPTLYPKLAALAQKLNEIKNTARLLILSNGSTIMNPAVREALLLFDVVKLSLDSAREQSYKKIDRPLHIDIAQLIESMALFRREYKGELVLESLFVKGVNDSSDDIDALIRAYSVICPDRIDLSTIDRPPAYDVAPITEETLHEFATKMQGLHVFVASRTHYKEAKAHYDAEGIRKLLHNRPFSAYDIDMLFDDASRELFFAMRSEGIIREQNVAGVLFYRIDS